MGPLTYEVGPYCGLCPSGKWTHEELRVFSVFGLQWVNDDKLLHRFIFKMFYPVIPILCFRTPTSEGLSLTSNKQNNQYFPDFSQNTADFHLLWPLKIVQIKQSERKSMFG